MCSSRNTSTTDIPARSWIAPPLNRCALFDAVYFHSADRIARDVAHQIIIVGELLKYGKQIVIDGKDYKQNPENKLTLTMLGAFAEFERAKIIERTTRGRLHRLRMGELSSTGHRIYGYHYGRRRRPHRPRSSSTKTKRRSSGRSSRCSRVATTSCHHLALPRRAPRSDPHGRTPVAQGSDQVHAQERNVCGHAVLQPDNGCHGSITRRQPSAPCLAFGPQQCRLASPDRVGGALAYADTRR